MTGFDAGSAVEPMEYNFETVPGGKGKGVIPEPSTSEMKRFQKEFAQIMRKGAALDVSDEDAMKMTDKEFTDFQKKTDKISEDLDSAIARLCKDTPSVEEVASLPFRVKTKFSKWLMEQFAPEGGTAGTKQ